LICITELINLSFDELTPNAKKNGNLIANLQQIQSLSNFLQILIKDLNYFSESQFGRSAEYEEKETDLNSLVEFCVKIGESLLIKCNKNKKVELKVNIDERLPEKINTDEWRLKQILVNLISNAIKFTLSGSISLNISLVENENEKEKEKRKKKENEINSKHFTCQKIKFVVTDTGVGIKESKQKNIFKPFQKDSMSNLKLYNEFGTGLGLSIANEIATNFGQGLEFKSSQGEGTSFWFYLPLPLPLPLLKQNLNKTGDNIKNKKNIKNMNINDIKQLSLLSCQIPYGVNIMSLDDSSASDESHSDSESINSASKNNSVIKETKNSIFSKVRIYFIYFNVNYT